MYYRLTLLIMRSNRVRNFAAMIVLFLSLAFSLVAQRKFEAPPRKGEPSPSRAEKKYPALLWEISGNGLTKPSYLFGTMHVSSKLVFHLSDSFYLALKSVDAVALELNPDTWQGEMVSMNNIKENYTEFVRPPRGNYLTENSFRIDTY